MSINQKAPSLEKGIARERAKNNSKEESYLTDLSETRNDRYIVVIEDGDRVEDVLVPSTADLGSLLEVERTRNGKLTREKQYETLGHTTESEEYDAILAYESLFDGSRKEIKAKRL